MSQELLQIANALVQERIRGHRKGSKEPSYLHSIRVGEALGGFGFPEDVVLAGVLHDIIEDGDVSANVLVDQGFSKRTVELVQLCTHDDMIEGGDARWIKMMAGLVDARDKDAWAIKLADLTDNVKTSDTMPKDRQRFMREAKAPFLLRLSWNEMGETPIWEKLKETLLSKSVR